MDMGVFYATLFATFAFCAKPGPGYLMEISRLLSDGLRVAAAIGVGAIIGNSVFLWVGGLGLSMLGNKWVLLGLQLGAGLYLVLYVIWSIYREVTRGQRPTASTAGKASLAGWVLFGLVNALINPFNITFYAAVLPNFVAQGNAVAYLALLNVAAIFFLIVSRSLYYAFAISFKRIMMHSDYWKVVTITAHIVFLIALSFPLRQSVQALLER